MVKSARHFGVESTFLRTLSAASIGAQVTRDDSLPGRVGLLRVFDFEPPPAEETSVDRPGARAQQREGKPQHPDHHAIPPVGGLRVRRPKRVEGSESSGNRCPKTDEQKDPQRCRQSVNQGGTHLGSIPQCHHRMSEQGAACDHTDDQQPHSGRAVGKC